MPVITLKFEPDLGPVLTVAIARPRSILSQQEMDGQRSVRFLIDTGASLTSISPRIAEDIGLPILGQVPMRSVTHEVLSNLYMADLMWGTDALAPLSDIRLMEFPMADDRIDGLLGRDLLCNGLIILNGHDQTMTIAY